MLRAPVYAGLTIIVSTLAISSGCAQKKTTRVATPSKNSSPASRTPTATPAPTAVPAKIGETETGFASWYGNPYHGRRTASGEIYDMEEFTAAHRTLPFQTWVEVTDLDNGKKVEVRITDRGPFVDGRVIDLSLAAARKIEMVGPGVAKVKLKVIKGPSAETDLIVAKTEVGKIETAKVEVPKIERPPPTKPTPVTGTPPPPTSSAQPLLYAVQVTTFVDRNEAEKFALALRNRHPDLINETRTVLTGTVWRVLVGRDLSADAANVLAGKLRNDGSEAFAVPETNRER